MIKTNSELTRKRFRETESGNSVNDDDEPSISKQPKLSSREDGSPYANSLNDKEIAPIWQTKNQNPKKSRQKLCPNSSSSSSSSLASNSQHTSVEDISGGDERDHDVKTPSSLLADSRNRDQSDTAICSSEFTSEYASSSTTSDGASDGKIRRHTYTIQRDEKKQRSSPVLVKDNRGQFALGELKPFSSSDNVHSEARDTSSGSDIDAIIRRAKYASKPTADSSSSSDEISFFNEAKYSDPSIADKAPRIKNTSIADAPSVCNSSKTSDSNGGLESITTSCLDGIASDIDLGEGGFFAAESGSEIVAKNADSSSSDREIGNHKSPAVDKLDRTESTVPHDDESLQAASDQQARKSESSKDFHQSSVRENPIQFMPYQNDSAPSSGTENIYQQSNQNYPLRVDISSILNTSYLSEAQVQKLPPIHLDCSLIKRLDEALTKSHESLEMLKKWDASMGLKSSHSKTMTQSARSRKKLHSKIKRLVKKLDSLEKK
ncbi:hypothetical protein ACHAXS_010919 [Conticribra weissflogii]